MERLLVVWVDKILLSIIKKVMDGISNILLYVFLLKRIVKKMIVVDVNNIVLVWLVRGLFLIVRWCIVDLFLLLSFKLVE